MTTNPIKTDKTGYISSNQYSQIIAEMLREAAKNDPQAAATIVDEVTREFEMSSGMWKNGKEPMPFDEFCFKLDGNTLFPRQLKVFQDAGLIKASAIFSTNRVITELVLLVGKGGGKDLISAKLISYLTYCILHMDGDPALRFGLGHGSDLAILNVAPSEDIAKQVFFEPYLKKFIKSDLFKPFIFKESEQILSSEIRFPQVNLTIYSKHSRSSGIDGYNTVGWVMDEADDFMAANGHANAKKVHDVLRSSANTRMNTMWLGAVLSYPRYEDGFMIDLYNRAATDPTMHRDMGASWDFNLKIHRTDPGIEADYQNDPVAAMAMYECIPSSTQQAFFEYPEKILEAVDKTREPAAIVVEDEITNLVQDEEGNQFEVYYTGAQLVDVNYNPGHTYFLAGDGGLKGDSYTICLGHIDSTLDSPEWFCPQCVCYKDEEDQSILLKGANYEKINPENMASVTANIKHDDIISCGFCGITPMDYHPGLGVLGWHRRKGGKKKSVLINGRMYDLPIVYEDAIIEIKPYKAKRFEEKNKPVHLPSVQTLCEQLINRFNVVKARFDPWQTAQLVQALQSTTYRDVSDISFANPEQFKRARLVKAMLYANLIRLLPNDKRDVEWKRLNVKGTKVDHPPNGSKDLYDAEAIMIWLCATYSCNLLDLKMY